LLPVQDADPANCGGGAQQFFLSELPEDTAAGEKRPGDETGYSGQRV
jgi:hypothetical protein